MSEKVEGIVKGLIGGFVGGLVTSKMIKLPKLRAHKEVVEKKALPPETSYALLSKRYQFAIVLFHGDGDPEVKHSVKVNNTVVELLGDEQAIEVLANESVEIVAVNTSTTEPKNTMTIEILSLEW
jgi:hypothetical protein